MLLSAQRVDRLTVEDGLSQGFVRGVLCDSDGFLWATTLDGLNRYDGTGFRVFRHDPSDPYSLPSNHLIGIFEDTKDRLWVISDKGLHLFDRRTYRFYSLAKMKGVLNARHLSEDPRGRLWAYTRDTLYCLEIPGEKGLTVPEVAGKCRVLRWWYVPRQQYGNFLLIKASSSGLYLSTSGGLYRLSYDGSLITPVRHDLGDTPVNAVWEDAETAALWFKSDSDIGKLEGGKIVKSSFRGPPGMYSSLVLQRGGSIYFIAANRIYRWNGSSASELPYVIPQEILSADMDQQGNIWLGTNAHGLRKIMPNRYHFPTVAEGVSIAQRPFQDQAGHIWINSLDLGSRRLDPQTGVLQDKLIDINNRAALQARDGRYWAWTYRGLVSLSEPGAMEKVYPLETYRGWGAVGLWEDRRGNILLGMPNPQLIVFHPKTERFTPVDLSAWFPDNETPELEVMCETPDGALWIGTEDGLLRLEAVLTAGAYSCRALYTYAPDERGLSDRRVLSLLPDPADPNVLWVGAQHGLNRMDIAAERFQRFTSAREGLPNDVIYSMLPGGESNLWLGTNNGLIDFNMRTGSWRHYTTTDGLPASEFNRMAALALRDGRLLFGSVNGAVIFEPARTRHTFRVPHLRITELRVNNQAQAPRQGGILEQAAEITHHIVLDHDEDNLGLSLALLDYVNSKANCYQYQLQGVDTGWVNLGNERKVNFAHLSPGTYVFRARGCNSDGAWSEPATLDIQVLQPWWRRWGALFLFAAMFAGVIAWIVRAWLSEVRLRDQLTYEHREAERLKELDAFKSKLYTDLTHEFRSPLTMLLGLAEQLSAQCKGEPGEKARHIERHVAGLLRLTNQLLDLSKLESQLLQLHIQPGDLVAFLRRIAEPFALAAANKEVGFATELSREPLWLDFDAERLQQVVDNLLSNALKYTPPGGDITLRLVVNEEGAHISVQDTGIGMPSEHLDHIFERFYQIDNPAYRAEGTGIGLAYVHELIKLMGGDIRVVSEPGVGSVFTVKLPVRTPALSSGETATTVYPPPPPSDASAPLVLVIEDQADIAELVSGFLRPQYRVELAADGRAGLGKARVLIPDIVVCDVMMPGMDGYAVVDQLKRDVQTNHIPVVMLTARADEQSRMEGLRHGADVYLTKPFKGEELLLHIHNLLRLRATMQARYQALGRLAGGADTPAALPPMDDEFVRRIFELISRHYSESSFGVGDLQRAVGLSSSQLHRKMKALTGNTAGHFLRVYRLEQARRFLMERPDWTVAEVAYHVGFQDPNYFSRAFSAEFGHSPREQREESERVGRGDAGGDRPLS